MALWGSRSSPPSDSPERVSIQALQTVVEAQVRLIHRLETELCLLKGLPPPPLPPRSESPLPDSSPRTTRLRGEEDVSLVSREERRLQDLKSQVTQALPEYLRHPRLVRPSDDAATRTTGGWTRPDPDRPDSVPSPVTGPERSS